MLQEKTGTRDINRLGGLWKSLPRAGGAAMFLAMASLGLPGMGNFVAEFLVLAGSYRSHQVVAIIAAVGLIPAAVYSLHLIQKTFHGKPREKWEISDAGPRHVVVLAAMIAVLIWLGLYPQSIIDTAEPALRTTEVTTAVPARSHPTGWSLGYHEHVDMTAIEIPAETEEPLNDLR
jgi:NADH-quinone oxidoreductase subunit M